MKQPGSQAKLKKSVLEQSLCTGCGACAGLCPYQVIYKDRTVQLFDCDLPDGKCHAFCPRTPTDYSSLRSMLYEAADLTDELGSVRGFFLSRAVDSDLRSCAQHGGTVTALLTLAMNEGLISAALVSGQNDALEQEGRLIQDKSELRRYAKSKFIVSPTVAAFHRMTEGSRVKIGMVATPCQAQALAKIKTSRIEGYNRAESIGLVVGLFCGWTLSLEKFQNLLQRYQLSTTDLQGMDIPAGRNVLELQTSREIIAVPMDEVDACIRSACRYCVDSTAEFADLSVGAARYGGDPEEMRGWNQVIVRNRAGADLIDLARKKDVLEIREAPAQALQELKNAAAEKKRKALKRIIKKSGSAKNLLYLNNDPVITKYLKAEKKIK